MTINTISTLPTAPARTDAPATFISRADAFLAALVTMQGELNTSIGQMNTDIAGVNTDATTASNAATAAAASQAAAEAASNATEWVSGTSYSAGDVVYSPVDYKSYRANTATSGTTDPSASTDWTALGYELPSQTGNAGKFLTTDGTNESWGTVSAGGSITATASGSITAGDALVLNSDGTVSSASSTDLTSSLTQSHLMSMLRSYFPTTSLFAEKNGSTPVAYDKNSGNFYYISKITDGSFYYNEVSKLSFDDFYRPSLEQSGTLRMAVSTYFFYPYSIALNHKNGIGLLAALYSQDSEVSFIPLRFNDSTLSISPSYDQKILSNCNTVYNMWYLEDVDKYVVYFRNGSGYPSVCTITSSSIDQYDFNDNTNYVVITRSVASSDPRYAAGYYDEINNKFIFIYNNGNVCFARAATLSGDAFTFGTEATVSSGNMDFFKPKVDYCESEDVYLFSYRLTAATDLKVKAATLSGTTFSFGSELSTGQFTNYGTAGAVVAVNPLSKAFSCGESSYRIINVSGTTLTNGTSGNLGNDFLQWNNKISISDGNLYYDKATSSIIAIDDAGTAVVGKMVSTDLTPRSFVGFANSSAADSENVTVTVKSGTNTNQSGLTIGEAYYLDVHGGLTTVKTGIKAGVATSSTNLLMV